MSDPVATVLERSSGALTRPSSGVGRGRKGDGVDREKMLEVTLQQIEKQHGKGAVMKLGEHPMNVGMTTIPTGSLALDIALGVGGIPRGRVVEVFGPEGSGKTTVCLHIIAEAQRQGGIAAFIDAEHALRRTHASWGSTSTSSWSVNPIPASRRSRSQTCWCGRARCISS